MGFRIGFRGEVPLMTKGQEIPPSLCGRTVWPRSTIGDEPNRYASQDQGSPGDGHFDDGANSGVLGSWVLARAAQEGRGTELTMPDESPPLVRIPRRVIFRGSWGEVAPDPPFGEEGRVAAGRALSLNRCVGSV